MNKNNETIQLILVIAMVGVITFFGLSARAADVCVLRDDGFPPEMLSSPITCGYTIQVCDQGECSAPISLDRGCGPDPLVVNGTNFVSNVTTNSTP